MGRSYVKKIAPHVNLLADRRSDSTLACDNQGGVPLTRNRYNSHQVKSWF